MDKQETASAKEQEQPTALTADLIKPFLDQHFAELDQDRKDGFISKKELTQALLGGKFKGADANVAEAILDNFHALELQSNDEWGTENNGITKKDAAAFEQHRLKTPDNDLVTKIEHSLNATEHDAGKFINLVSLYKANIDDDKSGTLGKSELAQYVASGKDRDAAKGAAQFLLDHFDEINELGSKNAYKGLLAGDKNAQAIGAQELKTLGQILGPEKAFRTQLSAELSHESAGAGTELGKQGRMVAGRGDSMEAAIIGTAMEVLGGMVQAHAQAKAASRYEMLLDDFQARKAMIDSWKFFK